MKNLGVFLCLVLVVGIAWADSKSDLPEEVLDYMKDVAKDAEKLTSKLKNLLDGEKIQDEALLEKFKHCGPKLGKSLFQLTQEMLKLGPFLGFQGQDQHAGDQQEQQKVTQKEKTTFI